MTSPERFVVQLAPAAARSYEKLPAAVRARMRRALEKLAADVAAGRRGGKTAKTVRGTSDTFHRLRVGDYRVMFDVVEEDRVILVLGIAHRSDLEAWLRNR